MCTHDAHSTHVGEHHHARIPLTASRRPTRRPTQWRTRWTRRRLLVDFGAAGAGVVLLGACSSDGVSTTADPTTVDSTTGAPPAADVAATDPAPADPQPTESGPTDSAPTANPGAAELQLQHVSLGFVNAFVLARGSEAAIVDTGVAGSGDAILEGLAALSLGPEAVRHVVLTHEHGDHVGGLAELEGDLPSATVYAGAGDIESVRTSRPLDQVGDGDEILGLGVIATPGHTPGSISLFDADTGLLVAGDTINGDGSGGLTGANPDFTADMATAGESIARMAELMPRVAAFGHGGGPVTVDVAAQLLALVGG
ncbi:MAG: MBL fold metallo-hydrolase [Actinomycetota bacterium]